MPQATSSLMLTQPPMQKVCTVGTNIPIFLNEVILYIRDHGEKKSG